MGNFDMSPKDCAREDALSGIPEEREDMDLIAIDSGDRKCFIKAIVGKNTGVIYGVTCKVADRITEADQPTRMKWKNWVRFTSEESYPPTDALLYLHTDAEGHVDHDAILSDLARYCALAQDVLKGAGA